MKKEMVKVPKYEWFNEEGIESLNPTKRKINKTMEITESFTFFDTLKYVAQMEKAVEDKKAEIESMEIMIKAYKEEMEHIEEALGVTKKEEKFNIDLHEKLKAEEETKLLEVEKTSDEVVEI